jgi:phosphate-selective porin OprO/OprP
LAVTQGWIFDHAGSFPMQTETFSLAFFQFNSNVTGDGSRTRLLPQLSWYWKRAGFLAQYVYRSSREDILNGSSARFTDQAWSIQGSLFLTDDAASSGEVHPRQPFTAMQPGHWGAWEIALRYAEITLDPDIFLLGFADPVRNARHAESLTFALNWYLDSSLRFTVHYVHTDLAGAGPSYMGVRQEDGLMFRAQVTY